MHLARFEGQSRSIEDVLRDEFARNHPLLDDGAVHARWTKRSWQVTRIGEIWKRTGKIFAVPYDGTNAYPSFQFDRDGTPIPLMSKVLEMLPADMTPWQCAFWMTSPKADLGGDTPADCVQKDDDRVLSVAAKEGVSVWH